MGIHKTMQSVAHLNGSNVKGNQELSGLQRNKSVRISSWIHMEIAISEFHGSTRENEDITFETARERYREIHLSGGFITAHKCSINLFLEHYIKTKTPPD